MYYNGDTLRLPLASRKAIVQPLERLLGSVLARAATGGKRITASDREVYSNLWVSCGRRGVRVQTHYDTVETILVQLEGTKEVLSSFHTDYVCAFDVFVCTCLTSCLWSSRLWHPTVLTLFFFCWIAHSPCLSMSTNSPLTHMLLRPDAALR